MRIPLAFLLVLLPAAALAEAGPGAAATEIRRQLRSPKGLDPRLFAEGVEPELRARAEAEWARFARGTAVDEATVTLGDPVGELVQGDLAVVAFDVEVKLPAGEVGAAMGAVDAILARSGPARKLAARYLAVRGGRLHALYPFVMRKDHSRWRADPRPGVAPEALLGKSFTGRFGASAADCLGLLGSRAPVLFPPAPDAGVEVGDGGAPPEADGGPAEPPDAGVP